MKLPCSLRGWGEPTDPRETVEKRSHFIGTDTSDTHLPIIATVYSQEENIFTLQMERGNFKVKMLNFFNIQKLFYLSLL